MTTPTTLLQDLITNAEVDDDGWKLDRLRTLQAYVRGLEADAARWRASRAMCCSPLGPSVALALAWSCGNEAMADTAIDAAISATAKGK